jgi:hypothetical protein
MGFERSQQFVEHVVKGEPNNNAHDDRENDADTQLNQICFLPAFDGGDDRRAAFGTSPRMVADLSAAFVTLDECHALNNKSCVKKLKAR